MTVVAPTPPAEASAAVVDDCAAAMSSSSARVPTATTVSPSTRIASGAGCMKSTVEVGAAAGVSEFDALGSEAVEAGVFEAAWGANVRTTALENRRMGTSLEREGRW